MKRVAQCRRSEDSRHMATHLQTCTLCESRELRLLRSATQFRPNLPQVAPARCVLGSDCTSFSERSPSPAFGFGATMLGDRLRSAGMHPGPEAQTSAPPGLLRRSGARRNRRLVKKGPDGSKDCGGTASTCFWRSGRGRGNPLPRPPALRPVSGWLPHDGMAATHLTGAERSWAQLANQPSNTPLTPLRSSCDKSSPFVPHA